MPKVILIGLDGATWNEIKPLIAQGKLPNFKYLIDNGVVGTLESIDPPYTPIVWTSIVTGKNPESHGVYGCTWTRHDVKTLTIWDIVEDYGKSIGIFNWCVTWPPRQANGFIVPGPLQGSEETFPPELNFILKIRKISIESQDRNFTYNFAQKLKLLIKAMQHGMTVSTLGKIFYYIMKRKVTQEDEISEVRRALVGQHIFTDFYLRLYKDFKPFFSAFYLDGIDVVAHKAWKYYEPEKFKGEIPNSEKYGKFVPLSYIETDEIIGRILNTIDDETAVVVVSDHGTKSVTAGETIFDITVKTLFPKMGIERERGFYCDHKAYFSLKESEEEKILEQLSQVRVGEKGQKIFSISKCDITGLYSLKYKKVDVKESDYNKTSIILGDERLNLSEVIRVNDYRISGMHDKYGIFIAYGPIIKQGYEIGKVGITDIVPTLLYYLGMPVGKDMDGLVKDSLFEKDFNNKRIQYIGTYDTDKRLNKYVIAGKSKFEAPESIKNRLRALGYLS